MKIQLTLEEIWALQDIQRNNLFKPYPTDLLDAGLVYSWYENGGIGNMVQCFVRKIFRL